MNFLGARRIDIDGEPFEEFEGQKERPTLSLRQRNRLDRDRERGYSINVKQIVLAFAVEFVIIGLILVNNYLVVAQLPDATNLKTIQSLLFPIAMAMVLAVQTARLSGLLSQLQGAQDGSVFILHKL